MTPELRFNLNSSLITKLTHKFFDKADRTPTYVSKVIIVSYMQAMFLRRTFFALCFFQVFLTNVCDEINTNENVDGCSQYPTFIGEGKCTYVRFYPSMFSFRKRLNIAR